MLPFKTILCPLDFSEPSLEALAAAAEMAGHFGSRLLLVHVVVPVSALTVTSVAAAPVPPPVDVEPFQREQRRAARAALMEARTEHVPQEITVELHLPEGNPAECIASLAEEEEADLIVIATHGQTGWRRFLFGSVTEKVVRLAQRPVLTIHRRRSQACEAEAPA